MGLFGLIRSWVERKSQEDELRALTDRELKDMGLNRYEINKTN